MTLKREVEIVPVLDEEEDYISLVQGTVPFQ
jgi:hypothetical protein